MNKKLLDLDRSKWTHYCLLIVVSLSLMASYIWMAERQQYSSEFTADFGEDFLNIVTLGRQMVECRDLPTFMFPGKVYDGPVKPFMLYSPCLIFGYHQFIPVFMAALCRLLIALCCYFIARKMVSPLAGLTALVLCGAMDQWLVIFVFRYAFFYDIWILQSLLLALMTISWCKQKEPIKKQPGVIYCLTMGLIAGSLWYTHPLGSATVIAAAIFLLISCGKQIFTWRVPTVATAFFVGSLPFWIYWIKNPGILDSVQQFAQDNNRPMTLPGFVFSKEGYLWFLFSPSGNPVIRILVGLAFMASIVVLLRMLAGGIKNLRQKRFCELWNNGIPLPAISYGAIFFITLSFLLWLSSGMAQFVGIDFIYGMEIWFWLMLFTAFVIHDLIKRSHIFIAIAAVLAPFYIWNISIRDFPSPHPATVKRFHDIKKDSKRLIENGHTHILAPSYDDYMYLVIGPGGLSIAERFMPWSMPMAREVEYTAEPAILGSLHKPTLGGNAWSTTLLENNQINHSFNMPQSGKIIPDDAWTIDITNGSTESLPDLKDNDLWSSWTSPVNTNDIVFSIVFDKPRLLCRLMLWSHREDVDWNRSTYFNLASRGIKEDRDLSSHTLPMDMEILGLQENGDWIALADNVSERGYFWDGGRIFYDRFERHRTDVRFKEKVVSEIKIIDRGRKWRPRRISRLYFFETDVQRKLSDSKNNDITNLIAKLKEENISRVYADRFISAQLAKTATDIKVWEPSFLRTPSYKLPHDMDWPWYNALEMITRNDTAIVADSAFTAQIRRQLEKAGVTMKIYDFQEWSVFILTDDHDVIRKSGLVWCGWALFRYPDKSRQPAESIPTSGLPQGIDIAFDRPPLFECGSQLLGVDFSADNIKPGETISITYYWRLPHKWKSYANRPVVFAHYVTGNTILNDDHRILSSLTNNQLREVLPGEIFADKSLLHIPLASSPGTYELEIGLHHSDKRVEVKTRDKRITRVKRRAVWMPTFTIEQ